MKKHLKLFVVILLISCALNACTPRGTPTPESIEVTRIVEQTVEVPKIVEQTVEVPTIVKETVVVTEMVQPSFSDDLKSEIAYLFTPEHFDAMAAIYKHFHYLDTNQCKLYYDTFSREVKQSYFEEEAIEYCEVAVANIEVTSVLPFNYVQFVNDHEIVIEPENTYFFKVYDTRFEYFGSGETRVVKSINLVQWIEVILEDGEWKIGPRGGTSPFIN